MQHQKKLAIELEILSLLRRILSREYKEGKFTFFRNGSDLKLNLSTMSPQ